MDDSYLPEFCKKPLLLIGCGNIFYGDDAFGPAVVAELERRGRAPERVCLINAGTGARKYLFTLALSEAMPEEIVIIDAIDKGREPGELFEIELDDVPFEKTDDFSLHQVPTSNLLKEIKETRGVKVRVLVCQVSGIPDEIRPGLSAPVGRAVEELASKIEAELFSVA